MTSPRERQGAVRAQRELAAAPEQGPPAQAPRSAQDAPGTTVLVTGSRTWQDTATVHRAMDHEDRVQPRPITLIHGAAERGADLIADAHARALGWAVRPYPADWRVRADTPPWAVRTRADGERYSVLGGMERNDEMVNALLGRELAGAKAVVLGFNRGGSPGTSDCCGRARKLGIRTIVFTARADGSGVPSSTLREGAPRERAPRTEEGVRGAQEPLEEVLMPDDSGSRSESCDACGRPLVWALSKNDRPSPIVREPSPYGNCLLFRRDGALRYVVLPPGITLWLQTAGVPLRLNHFADCAKADRFRQRHDSNAPAELAPDPPEEAA